MPRTARQKSSTGIYHIMIRGADRRIIFADDEDCLRFLETLRQVRITSGFSLYTYCLMGNHVHLLLKESEEPIDRIFRRIGSSYVYYYNWKYQLHGHLFQDRFRSESVEDDSYFLDVLRYICQNPVKAGLSKTLFDYPWLGCTGIAINDCLLDSMEGLTSLHGDELREFVCKPCREEHLEFSENKRLTDREAIERICSAIGCNNVQEIAGWDLRRQSNAVREALELGVSIRQLSRLTAISKAVIERIMR